jgi:hypothetical protein
MPEEPMAEKPKSLLEGGPMNALDAGAARFDRLIEEVRAQRAAPAQAPSAMPVSNPLLPISPGEAWARNFQSHSIGPEARGVSVSDLAPVPRAALIPPAADIVPTRTMETAVPRPVETAAPMSVQIGKADRLERPKKSWLGRMFSRT